MTDVIQIWEWTDRAPDISKLGQLDVPVQAVMTDKNADIDALLAQAQTQAQALLDEG